MSIYRILWFGFSLVISVAIGVFVFQNPVSVFPMIDLIATIISILLGISLAISAILVNPPIKVIQNKIAKKKSSILSGNAVIADSDEAKRIEKSVRKNYTQQLEGQYFLFWIYYLCLLAAILLKFLSAKKVTPCGYLTCDSLYLSTIAFVFAVLTTFAFLWSALLPSVLKQISSNNIRFD